MLGDVTRTLALMALGGIAILGLAACGPSPASSLAALAPTAAGSSGASESSGTVPASASASPAVSQPQSPSPTPAVTPAGPFTLRSSAFAAGAPIPATYTCDGAGVSLPIAWTGIPAGTASLVLVIDDPDANGFVHWVVFDIDPSVAGLPEGVPLLAGGGPPQGRNSFGKVGYGGPCPPSGTHHYRFRLFAASIVTGLGGTPSASQVLAAIKGHTVGEADLTGTYKRG